MKFIAWLHQTEGIGATNPFQTLIEQSEEIIVRFSLTSLLFIVLAAFGANGQEMPKSSGSCSVSASGAPIRWSNGETSKLVPKGVFVTRFILSPGAPLHRMSEGVNILIVAMGDGELVNEAKEPKNHFKVTNGFVMLMRKDDPYLLRNIGGQSLDLVVIDVRK